MRNLPSASPGGRNLSAEATPLTFTDDGKVSFHPSCVTDPNQPTFDYEWQRRAFGLAVALSEFGHYEWTEFQQALIAAIKTWEGAPAGVKGGWSYYDQWVEALDWLIDRNGLLLDGYIPPEARTIDTAEQQHP